jgi:hypothetical protein
MDTLQEPKIPPAFHAAVDVFAAAADHVDEDQDDADDGPDPSALVPC